VCLSEELFANKEQFRNVAPEKKGPAGGYFLSKAVMIPCVDTMTRQGEDAAETSDKFLVVADGSA
jgi:hypothetical protein